MLELIVLGEIPGTSITLTLPWVLAISVIFGAISTVRYVRKNRELLQQVALEEITL